MTRLCDGHTIVDTDLEPDGRVRMTVSVDGEVVAAPTFSVNDYARSIPQPGTPSDLRPDVIASITKALGWMPEERPPWPALVLSQFDRDGLVVTRANAVGGSDV